MTRRGKSTQDQGDDLPKLAQPARRALNGVGITRLEQVASWRESDLSALHGIGPNAIEQLRQALAERGLSFAGEPPETHG